MISFYEVEKDKIKNAAEHLAVGVYEGDESLTVRDEIVEILEEYADMMDENLDTGVGVCLSHGCLCLRLFDMGRYIFVYPFELSKGAEPLCALDEVRAYAVKEELTLRVVDVPREHIGDTVALFSHADVSAADHFHSAFIVRAISECETLEKVPTVIDGGLRLLPIAESDVAEYAALCRDEEVNKYWGYDYREEVKNPPDAYFYNEQQSELERGLAVTFAVRWRESFIGEAVIYHFDLKGGAEIGFRLHKKYHGRGLGTRTLKMLFRAAAEIGLSDVTASVLRENHASVKLLEKKMSLICESGTALTFHRELV